LDATGRIWLSQGDVDCDQIPSIGGADPAGPGGKPKMTVGDSISVGGSTIGPGGGELVIAGRATRSTD